ncbi:pur operon repressor [Sporolactobacillus sp. Y61]|jgi:purine operon repressor|uniref:Pur operon repressor n=1 Tax=Sporolactobacillus sp. Y61 TaxID=3160863 RepID=A0AAU8IH91_9BACL|nr:pur operon repressor [Sporolactobacillus sp. THM19-2]RYL89822.1 pur operon repressor [Sporolactobacillus sp. THM19-2]
MKLRRSSRLVDMTRYLLQHPYQIVPLSCFSERYESAKSSISEDLTIIKENLESTGVGRLHTLAGAAGGVSYMPCMSSEEAGRLLNGLKKTMASKDRLLPGGYLYMTDILGDPGLVNALGRLITSAFINEQIDVVMTMETKGIPIAYAVASQRNVPVVIARRSSKVTEGSTVSINYISGSSRRIQTMVLPRRSLKEDAHVLIVDDFMKAGGTMKGMINMTKEFGAVVAGMAVFVEKKDEQTKLVDHYTSLLKLSMKEPESCPVIEDGNIMDSLDQSENRVRNS